MFSLIAKLFSKADANSSVSTSGILDYEKLILLDAERLAEQGIADAYQLLLPTLREHVARPAEVREILDADLPAYTIQCNGEEYIVYSTAEPGTEVQSWGRATFFLFLIVNKQLKGTGIQFYAVDEGNNLAGIFLSQEQALLAQAAINSRTDWPYIPELNEPWYGQYH
ncbi:hypothetical protein [Citrobacter freundii]|uniref:hypothetical protein n=1 Tax=Citrobacter freundii TaxID=546 RepID=UPI0015E92CAE|nr:hypothetical protein [Citrobacter freundii]QLS07690.1 hypothetical protein HV327_19720 [Citrobacter freundii]